MKLQIWISCAAGLCGLLGISGCDVHRTDPVPEIGQRTDPAPEIAPMVGTSEKEADRTRPAIREGAEALDAGDRQSRIDDMAPGAAVEGTQPSTGPNGRKNAAKREPTQFGLRSSQPATTPAEAEAGDARLASEVESALAAEPALRGSAIAVHSEDGVVTLRGTTLDTEGRILAAYVAHAVQGVRLVRNELAEAGKA
jgi:hypothetical protein